MFRNKEEAKKRKKLRKEMKKELLRKKELDENKKDVEFEKGDLFAMFLALSYYLFPILIGIFGILWLIIWLLFLK